jgi:uncharacterized membrane protein YgdD (TMEM256/DUF423 family)
MKLQPNRLFLGAAAIFAFIAVAAGAFGAHGLKNAVTPERLDVFKTAAHYELVHAVALMMISILPSSKLLRFAGWAFITGIVIFSGSLYLLVLLNVGWLGAITPIGGVAFLAGWAMLLVYAVKYRGVAT